MDVINWVILAFALLGALDMLIGNRFGLGKEFERGFYLFGDMALSMIGMLALAPAIGIRLTPLFEGFYTTFGIDPSIIPASLFANDMGGASLALESARNEAVGVYNAFVVSSMMGCVISFTIPFALGVVDRSLHKEMFLGFLCGIVTIPVGCIAAGLMSGLTLIQILIDLLPLIIISAVISVGLILAPELCVRIFKVFGILIKIVITAGLLLCIATAVSGVEIVKNLASLQSAAMVCVDACVILSGMFPLMFVVGKLLKKPMERLGTALGINAVSALGFIPNLVTNTTTFGMMRDMDKRGVVLNAAFSVSAAFVFGCHMSFTMALSPDSTPAVIVGKLISGVSAVILALIICKKKYPKTSTAPASEVSQNCT